MDDVDCLFESRHQLLKSGKQEHTEASIKNLLDSAFPNISKLRVDVASSFLYLLQKPINTWRNTESDLINDVVTESIGISLVSQHFNSDQPLTKDRFEYALKKGLLDSGIDACMPINRTNRGHDITVGDLKFNLKTEASAKIKIDALHISKWMELGKGDWILEDQILHFHEHLNGYDRILILRCLHRSNGSYFYELLEIPKVLLLRSIGCDVEFSKKSRHAQKQGFANVYDDNGKLIYTLYFDGGSERKLQVKNLKRDYCIHHASWRFNLDRNVPQ